jgi:hypothetical protein
MHGEIFNLTGATMKSIKNQSVDLGTLQGNMEISSRNLKSAATTLKRAQQSYDLAEAEYAVASRSLSAGVEQVRAATKVVTL